MFQKPLPIFCLRNGFLNVGTVNTHGAKHVAIPCFGSGFQVVASYTCNIVQTAAYPKFWARLLGVAKKTVA
jgi:hypothetical protein